MDDSYLWIVLSESWEESYKDALVKDGDDARQKAYASIRNCVILESHLVFSYEEPASGCPTANRISLRLNLGSRNRTSHYVTMDLRPFSSYSEVGRPSHIPSALLVKLSTELEDSEFLEEIPLCMSAESTPSESDMTFEMKMKTVDSDRTLAKILDILTEQDTGFVFFLRDIEGTVHGARDFWHTVVNYFIQQGLIIADRRTAEKINDALETLYSRAEDHKDGVKQPTRKERTVIVPGSFMADVRVTEVNHEFIQYCKEMMER